MAKETPVVDKPAPALRRPAAPQKFEAPDRDLSEFGVQIHQEAYIAGIVESTKVRELLDAFGLQERQSVVFPFQHAKRLHGEVWQMRIEPAADHLVDGAHVHGHHWVYKRDFPEQTAGTQ